MNQLEKKAIKHAKDLAEDFESYPTYDAIQDKMKELNIDQVKINEVLGVFNEVLWDEKDKVNNIVIWLDAVLDKDENDN